MDLLLLAPYDIHNPLPTLFEVFALDELQTALRNALSVGIFNLLDRAVLHVSPQFSHLQPFLPEIELVLAFLLEGQFLARFDATTTQRLFNLKLTRAVPRSPVISMMTPTAGGAPPSSSSPGSTTQALASTSNVNINLKSTSTSAASNSASPSLQNHHHQIQSDPRLPQSVSGISFAPLLKRQRVFMLLEAALTPYLVRRLDQLHSDWNDDTPEGRERRQRQERSMNPLQLSIAKGLAKLYPILKAVFGLTKVAVWLAYMTNRVPYPSLTMALSKIIMTRRTVGDEALQKMSKSSNRLFMFLSLAITWTIVGFEVADWWFRNGGRSSVLRERKGLPPPPAKSSGENNNTNNNKDDDENSNTNTTKDEDGICPICHNPVVNPCCNIASGYVCCYPCLAQHVREHGTCPVKSHIRITTKHIRRLFIE